MLCSGDAHYAPGETAAKSRKRGRACCGSCFLWGALTLVDDAIEKLGITMHFTSENNSAITYFSHHHGEPGGTRYCARVDCHRLATCPLTHPCAFYWLLLASIVRAISTTTKTYAPSSWPMFSLLPHTCSQTARHDRRPTWVLPISRTQSVSLHYQSTPLLASLTSTSCDPSSTRK